MPQEELSPEKHFTILTILHLVDITIIALFFLEIVVKWLDDFKQFWASGWNNFDFGITVAVRKYK